MTEITLLDGSIGQELVKGSSNPPTPLWSTSVMLEDPTATQAVHTRYFNAGATIATTNTYAIHRDRLPRAGLEDRFEELVEMAVTSAERARAQHGSGLIAGALGPLGASYRTDVTPPPAAAAPLFAELVELMKDHVDLFLFETVVSLNQARGCLQGCRNAGKPIWLAVSVDDEDGTRLRSGEPLSDLAPLVQEYDLDAVLINCSRPEAVEAALEIIDGFGCPFGAYANGFSSITDGFLVDAPTVDALEERKDLGPEAYADFAMKWVKQGATIVGGCCEVGPDHIAALAKRLKQAGHQIV